MKRFSMNLPPLAPDYSGACSALFSLDSTIVIHDASGCTGNYTCFDEPRWYASRKPVYCSGLRKMDAVFGNEQALLDRITRAWEVQRSALVAMVGSPVPMVIGTDFDGLAREIEQRTGVPAFGFFTTGTQPYPAGVAAACIAVIDRFAEKAPEIVRGSVNILGVTPLDMGRKNLDALSAFVLRSGFSINCCCAADWTLDALRRIGAAQLNLAATQAGVEIARHLEEKFGTPWLAGIPVGEKGAEEIAGRMRLRAAGEPVDALPEARASADALAAGDWVMAASVCCGLELDCGVAAAPAGLFGRTGVPETARTLDDEEAVEAAVQDAGLIVSDPLICALSKRAKCVEIPQYAVSSRLYRELLFIDKYFGRLLLADERKEG